MDYEKLVQTIKAAVAQYEEGAITDEECFNYIAHKVIQVCTVHPKR